MPASRSVHETLGELDENGVPLSRLGRFLASMIENRATILMGIFLALGVLFCFVIPLLRS
jgi:ABC-type multidrug transport system permease subunit